MAGRPKVQRTTIVDPAEILDAAYIQNESWCIASLTLNLNDTDAALVWLARRRLLRNSVICDSCQEPCKLMTYSQGIDGKRWACQPCGLRKSVREGSFFTKSHLTLKQIVMMIYCFAQDMPQNLSRHEAQIDNEKTVMDWFNFCREDAARYLERRPTEIGGLDDNGDPVIVEIDESKYFHRKYHRGAWREGHWVFGGVERGSGKCFLLEVPDRTAATLEPIILDHILPGSHIVSDGWASYNNISNLRNGIYTHSVVVHERHFVDPDDADIHTQNIENLWMRAKRKLKRQFGTSRILFPSYLKEFEFRCSVVGRNVFSSFLLMLAEMYPV